MWNNTSIYIVYIYVVLDIEVPPYVLQRARNTLHAYIIIVCLILYLHIVI